MFYDAGEFRESRVTPDLVTILSLGDYSQGMLKKFKKLNESVTKFSGSEDMPDVVESLKKARCTQFWRVVGDYLLTVDDSDQEIFPGIDENKAKLIKNGVIYEGTELKVLKNASYTPVISFKISGKGLAVEYELRHKESISDRVIDDVMLVLFPRNSRAGSLAVRRLQTGMNGLRLAPASCAYEVLYNAHQYGKLIEPHLEQLQQLRKALREPVAGVSPELKQVLTSQKEHAYLTALLTALDRKPIFCADQAK